MYYKNTKIVSRAKKATKLEANANVNLHFKEEDAKG